MTEANDLIENSALSEYAKKELEKEGFLRFSDFTEVSQTELATVFPGAIATQVRMEMRRLGLSFNSHNNNRESWQEGRAAFRKMDWGQSTDTLAKQTGFSPSRISNGRMRYHTRTIPGPASVEPNTHTWAQNYVFSGKQLKFWREKRGWSQTQCEHWLGVGRNRMSEWETGFRMPDASNVLRLCLLLDVHPRDMCEVSL